MIFILPAVMLGMLGSFHCVGMCGPLALSIPKAGDSRLMVIVGRILYNVGRTFTYALIGAILGLIGQGIFLAGMQQWFSIGLGSVLLMYLFFPAIFGKKVRLDFPQKIKTKMILLFKKKGLTFSFLIGMLNGLLPCGLVYMAVAGALATGDPLHGLLFMAAFGIGTMPLMLALVFTFQKFSQNFRVTVQKAIPAFVFCMAVVLILRGLNLGIPYLSPELVGGNKVGVENCE
jgi:sulfite exporter TauE/SafE